MSDEDDSRQPDIIDVDPPDSDDSEEPLGDLTRKVRARREAEEATELETDPFESVEIAEIDAEAVWESLAEGEPRPEERLGVGADVQATDETGEEYVVPKAEFCQQCPHFTAPPETACTHEGTTIVEVVDSDRFRVRNCPIVGSEPGASPAEQLDAE